MRVARVNLYRAIPPFVNRVTVGPITVRAFREGLKLVAGSVAEFALKVGRDVTEADVFKALGDVKVCAGIADLICLDQPRGFFEVWSNNRNLRALMRGIVEVETLDGLSQMWGLLDWSGERVKKGGGLAADIITISRVQGISPQAIFDMPMRDFLDLCDLLQLSAEMGYRAQAGDDPTLDPGAEPTPLPN